MYNEKYLTTAMEAYVGKKKGLVVAQAKLDKLYAFIKSNTSSLDNDPFVVNRSKELREFNKSMGDFFKGVDFDISFTALPIGANTLMPRGLLRLFKLSRNEEGVDIAKNLHVSINVSLLLINDNELTSEELMAIILHEVGHNFEKSAYFMVMEAIQLAISPSGYLFEKLKETILKRPIIIAGKVIKQVLDAILQLPIFKETYSASLKLMYIINSFMPHASWIKVKKNPE